MVLDCVDSYSLPSFLFRHIKSHFIIKESLICVYLYILFRVDVCPEMYVK